METFDPKPGTSNGGDTKAIDTAVAGIKIANGWNKLAGVMNDVAIIRSMTNKEGNHQRATYQLHTGYAPTGTVKHPNIGCVVANELGDPKFDLPHIVSIGSGTIGAGPARRFARAVRGSGPDQAAGQRHPGGHRPAVHRSGLTCCTRWSTRASR